MGFQQFLRLQGIKMSIQGILYQFTRKPKCRQTFMIMTIGKLLWWWQLIQLCKLYDNENWYNDPYRGAQLFLPPTNQNTHCLWNWFCFDFQIIFVCCGWKAERVSSLSFFYDAWSIVIDKKSAIVKLVDCIMLVFGLVKSNDNQIKCSAPLFKLLIFVI